MDNKTNKLSGTIYVQPEKTYTQLEVDNLLNEKTGSLAESGEIKAEIKTVDKQIMDEKTVENLVKKSNRILVSIYSHAFPVDLFPDVINVEEEKITIVKRHLLSSEVHSVDIKDISNVLINTAIIFSQLVIISNTFEKNEIKIKNLRPREAVYVRRIIEGLRVFVSKQIDTSIYTPEELVAKLEELSTTKIVT